MTHERREKRDKTLSLFVNEDLTVRVIPDDNHEFLMTTKQVASGYGVNFASIRQAHSRHNDELKENVHYVKGVTKCNTLVDTPVNKRKSGGSMSPENAQPHQIFWTKAGVIRLGFFVKSEQAKQFRQWAENLVLGVDKAMQIKEQHDLFGNIVLPEKKKVPYNPLTRKNVTSILIDVCEIEDKELRMRIITKLVGGLNYGTI
jgi:prophage antirepressor-like protein